MFLLTVSIIAPLLTVRSTLSLNVDIGNSFDYIINKNPSQTVSGQITCLPNDTLVDRMISDTGYGFAIQDATGGIWVYVNHSTFYDNDLNKLSQMVYGRWVTVNGVINTANGATDRDLGGMIRITPNSFNDITLGDLGDAVEPKQIEPDQVETNQGLLVQISDVVISEVLIDPNDPIYGVWGADYLAVDTKTDKSTSIWFYPPAKEYVIFNTTYRYIIGFASVFIKINQTHILEEEWEIWPRSSHDWMDYTQTTIHYTTTSDPNTNGTLHYESYIAFNIIFISIVSVFINL